MSKPFSVFVLLLLTFLTFEVRADYVVPLLRRVAVFPIDSSVGAAAEEAWWQMRELLTKEQKYLVASKRFMVNRGVFQSREQLKPADAIILGKILEAQCLITTWVKEREMHMAAYEGDTGLLLWEQVQPFHPALTVNEQINKLAGQLIDSFMNSIPYQGFQVTDELIAKSVYEREGHRFAQVYIGVNDFIAAGDPVQWITVAGDPTQAIFLGKPKIVVFAEGKVWKVTGDHAEVEIQKATDTSLLIENSLIRFPKETTRIAEKRKAGDRPSELGAEYLAGELKPVKASTGESSPTATVLAFIINTAGFLLLAF